MAIYGRSITAKKARFWTVLKPFKVVPDWQFKAVPERQKSQGFERPKDIPFQTWTYGPVWNDMSLPVTERASNSRSVTPQILPAPLLGRETWIRIWGCSVSFNKSSQNLMIRRVRCLCQSKMHENRYTVGHFESKMPFVLTHMLQYSFSLALVLLKLKRNIFFHNFRDYHRSRNGGGILSGKRAQCPE